MLFLPIPNFEGIYEISKEGVIRSIDRTIEGKDGVLYPRKGRTIIPSPNKKVLYPQVSLWKDGKGTSYYVHRLVAQLFVPNPLNLPEVNHLDGNRLNYISTNLEWCSSSENSQHAADTGLRVYTTRLTKAEFVECLFSIIEGESYLSLSNRVPYKVPFLSTKLRKVAQELGVEPELDASLMDQRITRARINGTKNQ